jgi:sacsin
LVNEINEILTRYPSDTIIFELLQNADDSGATEFHAVWDQRGESFSEEQASLPEEERSVFPSPELCKQQGPALVVFNNKQFTLQDFDNIANVKGSKKVADAGKTGRYGIGFNSVYVSFPSSVSSHKTDTLSNVSQHITDVPSFLSGKYLTFFDPLKSTLVGGGAARAAPVAGCKQLQNGFGTLF